MGKASRKKHKVAADEFEDIIKEEKRKKDTIER